MLLPLFNPHLDKEPHDQTNQQRFHQSKQPGSFSPGDAKGVIDAPSVLNDGVADRMFLTVAKHVNANHGGETVAQLPKDHPQHHGVGKKRFVGQEFHGVIGPVFGLFFPLLDAHMARQYAGYVACELSLIHI